jgi:2-keto-3-deoxy-L-rhamnonate aldolase RhmA
MNHILLPSGITNLRDLYFNDLLNEINSAKRKIWASNYWLEYNPNQPSNRATILLNAVKAAKYPPEGIRGVGPRRSIMYGFDDIKEYYKEWNKKAIIIVQIETIDGLNNVDEILSVNGVSGIFIGPNDLSSALGIFREFNNVTYTNAINKILNAAKSANKIAGIMTYSPEDALDKTKKGFNFIALANDITHLIKGFKDTFKTLNIL